MHEQSDANALLLKERIYNSIYSTIVSYIEWCRKQSFLPQPTKKDVIFAEEYNDIMEFEDKYLYTSTDVATYLVALANERRIFINMTKVQKLLYITYSVFLTRFIKEFYLSSVPLHIEVLAEVSDYETE